MLDHYYFRPETEIVTPYTFKTGQVVHYKKKSNNYRIDHRIYIRWLDDTFGSSFLVISDETYTGTNQYSHAYFNILGMPTDIFNLDYSSNNMPILNYNRDVVSVMTNPYEIYIDPYLFNKKIFFYRQTHDVPGDRYINFYFNRSEIWNIVDGFIETTNISKQEAVERSKQRAGSNNGNVMVELINLVYG